MYETYDLKLYISMLNLLLATFQTQVSGMNDVKKDRENLAKVLQEIKREKENLLEQVTQLIVEVIEANEIGRNDKAQLLETAKNFENLCAAVSEKEGMINSQHQVSF